MRSSLHRSGHSAGGSSERVAFCMCLRRFLLIWVSAKDVTELMLQRQGVSWIPHLCAASLQEQAQRSD